MLSGRLRKVMLVQRAMAARIVELEDRERRLVQALADQVMETQRTLAAARARDYPRKAQRRLLKVAS